MPCGEGFIRSSTPYYWVIKIIVSSFASCSGNKWTYWDQKRFTWPQSTFVVQIANRFRATTFPLLNSQKKICVVEYDILLIPSYFRRRTRTRTEFLKHIRTTSVYAPPF